ncbi:FUSC family protein [Nocardia inohanensis]|uniref:FUSC family protein n=1 Tax=Nocardia inohanensis TaxID=209246 RepID=UPI0008297A3B|nr:FUSC family protein [Nocardia inohanensis]
MTSESQTHAALPEIARVRGLLFRVPPVRSRVGAGVRSAAAFAVPAALVVGAGHPQEALFVTFGAFAVMYGDGRPIRVRGSMVAIAGLALLVSTTLGAIAGRAMGGGTAAAMVTTVLMTGIAVASVAVIGALRAGPPGPLFFALTASAGMVAAEAGVPIATITGFAALGWISALAVTGISVALDFRRGARWVRPPVPSIGYRLRRAASPHSHASTTTVRVFVACAIAGAAGLAIGSLRPYWAVIAALVILGTGPDRVRGHAKAIHRLAGTCAGLLLFAGLWMLHPSGYGLVAMLTVLMFGIELFIAGNYAIAVTFLTPTALFAGGAGSLSGSAGPMIRDRFLETVIGVIVAAIALNVVDRHAHRRGLHWSERRVRALTTRLATTDEPGDTLRHSLDFELTGYAMAGIDCAHNDSEWIKERWPEHSALLAHGRKLLEHAR